ncbi:D-alanine--D-alanine ligase [Oceanibaculum pacificum]|uniref:D-alanine--D-alanine ligase n=1 Tax=Oceanibaculum pacificum TaxID=580166 RepID=A0A154W0J4_9PROT|nr:D-alanine--D-alanine ligase [Oceanibaculum pacificum]KZD07009.1 D-alanine--D-alanine ligase [Oceanibaculum pacificum]
MKNRADTHVVVLMGGWSAEREVSLTSGKACVTALREAGYRVSELDMDRELPAKLAKLKPDVVFNALHGPIGEDGSVQGLLNIMGIPYTHSGVMASSIAMNKPAAKQLFSGVGLRCPEGKIVGKKEVVLEHPMQPPYVLKPIDEGSSIGVRIVPKGSNAPLLNGDWPFGDEVLVETYIPGRELTVGVMSGKAMAVTELVTDEGFYDYQNKYTADSRTRHIVPADLPKPVYEQAMRMAETAHAVLGCRGVTRSDFRYDDTENEIGALYLLEINTQPGMTPMSLVPEQAAHLGISFADLVARMVEEAQCDF